MSAVLPATSARSSGGSPSSTSELSSTGVTETGTKLSVRCRAPTSNQMSTVINSAVAFRPRRSVKPARTRSRQLRRISRGVPLGGVIIMALARACPASPALHEDTPAAVAERRRLRSGPSRYAKQLADQRAIRLRAPVRGTDHLLPDRPFAPHDERLGKAGDLVVGLRLLLRVVQDGERQTV